MAWKYNPFTGELDKVQNPGTGTAAIEFATDSGNANPTGAGVITIAGGTSIDTSGSGSTVTIDFAGAALTDDAILIGDGTALPEASNTFMAEGTTTTVGAVNGDILTLDLGAVAAGYSVHAMVVGFETTTPAVVHTQLFASARTTGAAATLVGEDRIVREEGTFTSTNVFFTASGNNLIVRCLGESGFTMNWRATLKYVKVS